MSTSQTFKLSKPVDREPIRVPTLAYFRSRNRRKLHSLVLQEFKDSGISQIELCKRLRKEPSTISKMLSTPGNWGLDIISDLLFAIRGGELKYELVYPLDKPARNFRGEETRDESSGLLKAASEVPDANKPPTHLILGPTEQGRPQSEDRKKSDRSSNRLG